MNRLEEPTTNESGRRCAHARLKALDYDESYRWVVRCTLCGAVERLSQAEYRRRRAAERGSIGLEVSDVGDSGRYTPPAGTRISGLL